MSDYSERYFYLQNKIQNCYEEYREARHLQMNTVTAGATVLGIISGISYWINMRECNNIKFSFQIMKESDNTIVNMINEILLLVTFQRLVFWLVAIVFCATFLYIAKVGIENIMRYFYIRNLEMRCQEILRNPENHNNNEKNGTQEEHLVFYDSMGKGSELDFSEYAAPVLTNSPKHIGSIPTFLHFACNYGALGLSVIFCFLLVLSQFLLLPKTETVDIYAIYIILAVMIFTLVFYIRFSDKAQETVQFAWDEAHHNYEFRFGHNRFRRKEEQKTYPSSYRFKKKKAYLIFPRPKAIKSSLLFVLGVTFAKVYVKELEIYPWLIVKVFFSFELLVYQCRYLVNDIRGIIEDDKERKKRRLSTIIRQECRWEYEKSLLNKEKNNIESEYSDISDIDKKELKELPNVNEKTRRYVGRAVTDIVIRMAFAIMFFFYSPNIVRTQLFWCIFGLILITMLYECSKDNISGEDTTSKDKMINRRNNAGNGVFLTVGLGYPLRFLVGIIAMNISISELLEQNYIFMSIIIVSIYFYGSFASIMSWNRKILMNKDWHKIEFSKKHFEKLKNKLIEREKKLQGKHNSEAERKAELKSSELFGGVRIWNSFYSISILAITIGVFLVNDIFFKNPITIIFVIGFVLISLSSFMRNFLCIVLGVLGGIAYLILLSLLGLSYINILMIFSLLTILAIYLFQRFAPFDIVNIIHQIMINSMNSIKEHIVSTDVYELLRKD